MNLKLWSHSARLPTVWNERHGMTRGETKDGPCSSIRPVGAVQGWMHEPVLLASPTDRSPGRLAANN